MAAWIDPDSPCPVLPCCCNGIGDRMAFNLAAGLSPGKAALFKRTLRFISNRCMLQARDFSGRVPYISRGPTLGYGEKGRRHPHGGDCRDGHPCRGGKTPHTGRAYRHGHSCASWSQPGKGNSRTDTRNAINPGSWYDHPHDDTCHHAHLERETRDPGVRCPAPFPDDPLFHISP